MTITKKITKKIISIAVCIALLMSYLPTLMASAAPKAQHYSKIADTNTMSNWKKYFDIEDLDTSNAGGVWTDKTVLSDATASELGGLITMKDSDRNFLTVLSSLAANKEVVGYSTIPTDTVLILDLSGSMENSNSETALINAANKAIADLLAVNNNNRVGVVLYSASGSTGASTYSQSVTRILPIDRYTTGADNVFLKLSGGGTVSVDNDVSGTDPSADLDNTKSFDGGTYIQAGLWEAMKMFEEMDTVIGGNNWQTGEARMPITVLMSDGAPSTGTSYYDDVENSRYISRGQPVYRSNVGNGDDKNLTAGNAFLTQLTASYVSNRIDAHYNTAETGVRSLFYTLGFDIGSNSVANAVMNPDASTLTDSLWTSYNSLTGTQSLQVRVKGRSGSNTDVAVSKNSYATSKSYVDGYFSASGTGLENAFNQLVEEIILQSRYYPTHLEGGSSDFSGYVEFADTVGEYMEIKDVKGILLGSTLYSGQMMASKLADSSADGLGTVDNPTNLGDEFIRAVKTRLGIALTEDAQALVAKAYAAGQLRYNSTTDWSNYIGWYAKADGSYNGFWDENSTDPAPAGSVYKIKSYGFLGETVGSIKNSDMMYMSVQVRTDIATGTQTVFWKIPAALIPLITYEVSLMGTNVDTAIDVHISLADDNPSPIRLVYETGLRSDINEFNVTRIVESKHIAADGNTRVFWNNYFDISSANHEDHKTTTAQFTPSLENERYYYTFDSAVLKKVGSDYEIVGQSETPDPNGEYYRRCYIFTDDSTTPVFFYEKISSASITTAVELGWQADYVVDSQTAGAWVVPAGTPARELDMYSELKNPDLTNSAHMVFYPYLSEQNDMVYIDMNLGNNGLLSVVPETGIKISKTIDVYETGTADTFSFRITATGLSGSFNYFVTDLDAVPTGEPTGTATFQNGVYEFTLRQNQTIWFSGIPAGTAYTVEELSSNSDYKLKSVHVNGVSTGAVATGTVAQYLIDDVDFVNTAMGEGNLYITKQVIDANGTSVDINNNVKFTAEVTLTDTAGAPVSGSFETTAGSVTVPSSGKFTVTLSEGETVAVRGLPEKTKYSVVETSVPAGFAFNSAKSTLTGEISEAALNQAVIVNDYRPVGTDGTQVNVEVVKQITGNRTEWQAGESYSFIFQKVDPATSIGATVKSFTIDENSTIKSAADGSRVAPLFNLADEEFDAAGEYFYRVVEVAGTQGGVTYDTAERRMGIIVADSDMDGDLEIVEVRNWLNVTVSGEYTVTAAFNNVYQPTGSATTTVNIQKEINDNYSLAGYQFALYDADPVNSEEANELIRSTVTDAAGKAKLDLTYAANRASMEGEVYTYYLAEIKGTNPNVTYAETVYVVNVTVKDNGDGTISATNTITGVAAGNPATFTNTFTRSAADYVTISGNKVISTGNRAINAGEFTFKLTPVTVGAPMPASDTATNDANGYFAFDTITFDAVGTYEYKVTELGTNPIGGFTYDSSEYDVTVVVTDTGNVELLAEVTVEKGGQEAEIVFANAYDPKDATVSLTATKLLTGKTMQDDEFEFEIAAVTAGAPMPDSGSVARNNAAGHIFFGVMTYDKAGTYVYTVTEKNGGNDNYIYDSSVYNLTVTVTDNSRGILTAEISLKKDNMPSTEIVFRNGYTPDTVSFDIITELGVEKTLKGRRDLKEGEFEFIIINAISGLQIGDSVRNGADGKVNFPALELPAAGAYSFKILEKEGSERGITYDTNQYLVNITVTQAADGTLSVGNIELHIGRRVIEEVGGVPTEKIEFEDITRDPIPKVKFENSYKPDPAVIELGGIKELIGRDLEAGEFTFTLWHAKEDEEGGWTKDNAVEQVTNNADGSFSFSDRMAEQTASYIYFITEDATNPKANVTYDTKEYMVVAEAKDNGDGTMNITYKYSAGEDTVDGVRFTNTYTEPTPPTKIPDTGDSNNTKWLLGALLFVSALGIFTTSYMSRRKES